MRLTRRSGLPSIVGLAVLGGILVAGTGAVADGRISDALADIQQRYLPKMKLAAKLDAALDKISRAFQDAVSSQDAALLGAARTQLDDVSEMLAAAQPSITSGDAAALRNAFKAYYGAGLDVSRRLMASETGESLLQSIQEMQDAEKRVADQIAQQTGVDTEELDRAFSRMVTTQRFGTRARLAIIISFLTVIAVLAVYFARRLRNEEERNYALYAQAWAELDAFSAPRGDRAEPTDLTQTARDAANLMRHRNPTLTVELVAATGIKAEIDASLARLLFEALLKNAWMSVATQHAARVEFGVLTIGGQTCYFIRDNGESFDAAAAKSLFSSQLAFGTVKTDRPELATAQRVVRRCGGRIWAERTPELGSNIYFTLPTSTIRAS